VPGPGQRRLGWFAALALGFVMTAAVVGCTTDVGGHSYEAYNESDQAVIITLSLDQQRTLRIPARSRSDLEGSFGEPTAARPWNATVFEASCRLLGTVGLGAGHRTIHIGGLGAVEVVETDQWHPATPQLPFASAEAAEPCG
jgi:hypothetical protein